MKVAGKTWVHFTSHSCRVVDPTAKEPKSNFSPGRGDMPYPIWRNCIGPHRRKQNLYTTRLDEVTCPTCRRAFRHFDHALSEIRTHYYFPETSGVQFSLAVSERLAFDTCCRKRGAPLLVPASELERDERLLRAYALEQFQSTTAAEIAVTAGQLVNRYETWHVERLEIGVAALSPEDLEALRPAIDEYRMIADVLLEVRKMRERAELVIQQHVASLRGLVAKQPAKKAA